MAPSRWFVVYVDGQPFGYSEHRDNAERFAASMQWRYPLSAAEVREESNPPNFTEEAA